MDVLCGCFNLLCCCCYCCQYIGKKAMEEQQLYNNAISNSDNNNKITRSKSRKGFLIYLLIFSVIFSGFGLFTMTRIYSKNSLYSFVNDKSKNNNGILKHVKGIEIGIGGIILLFPIIFLVISITFLVFICGKNKEFQVLSVKKYFILNIIKILCIVLSSILIVLSLLYSILITKAYNQIYFSYQIDSLTKLIGHICGALFIVYYIACVILFSCEFKIFKSVGTALKPGPEALYDINGNPIFQMNPVVVVVANNIQNVPNYQQNIIKNQNTLNEIKKQNINNSPDTDERISNENNNNHTNNK